MDDLHELKAMLSKAALTLLNKVYKGPAGAGDSTWFVDNEPDCGNMGSLRVLSAASHAGHLLFSSRLANRAARGENPYPGADWKSSWKEREVDAVVWKASRP